MAARTTSAAPAARERARELLARFDLEDAADRPVKRYSGGMRRRLDLAGALVAQPSVLFLDEPTTGLDPRSRLGMWDVIEELVAGGTTLLLTTRYLEEADRLADQIAVIDHGRVIAEGTADQLEDQVGGERLELSVASSAELTTARTTLADLAVGPIESDDRQHHPTVPVAGGSSVLMEAIRRSGRPRTVRQHLAPRTAAGRLAAATPPSSPRSAG